MVLTRCSIHLYLVLSKYCPKDVLLGKRPLYTVTLIDALESLVIPIFDSVEFEKQVE